jgi:prepilin-type N-terminal cleavage/methylation domain-containing protein
VRRTASCEGFTLPEVLVALLVFGTMAGALTSMLLLNVRSNRIAKEMTAATSVAQSQIEAFRASPTAPTNGTDTVTLDNTAYTRTWTVAAGPVPGTTRVTVSVTWREPQPEAVQLTTYVTS